MFDGFTLTTIETDEVTIRLRHGGSGPASPPSARLSPDPRHVVQGRARGSPNTTPWSAPICAATAAAASPTSSANHETYSKRAMARDQLEVMKKLGFDKFHVAGHDRGGRCAYRLALDSPASVTQTRRARHRADGRHAAPRRLAIRHGLLALVLPRAGAPAARAHDQRGSDRLPVPSRPGRRPISRPTKISCRTRATPPRSTRCAKTIAPR